MLNKLVFCVVVLFLYACSSDSEETYSIDTSNAIGFGYGRTPVTTTSDITSHTPSSIGCESLVKEAIDTGVLKSTALFNNAQCEDLYIVDAQKQGSLLVMNGSFDDGCYIVTVPLNKVSAEISCVTTDIVSGREGAFSQTWGTGMAVTETTIFYATKSLDKALLKAYSNNTTETLLTLDSGDIVGVYANDNGNLLLYVRDQILGHKYYYGNSGGELTPVDAFLDEPVRIGEKLFIVPDSNAPDDNNANFAKLAIYDLSTGVYLSHNTSGLGACWMANYGSEYFPSEKVWESSQYAYWIGSYNGNDSLCRIDVNGNASAVDTTYSMIKGIRKGNDVLIISKTNDEYALAKLDLANDTYSPSNMLPVVGMSSVLDMRIYQNGIVLYGILPSGEEGKVYYNTQTNSVESLSETPLQSDAYITL